MNKILGFFILLIISSSLASAVQLVLNDRFHPGETLIAELKGNIISPIKHSDVNFYYGNKLVSMDYDVTKLGNSYFIYAVLPVEEKDYRMVLSNVAYFEQGKESTSNITANVSVNGSVADFSVTPGVIVTNKDFLVTIKNLGSDLTLTSGFNNQQTTTNVGYGRVKELQFSIVKIPSSGIYPLTLTSSNTSYSLPVYVITGNASSNQSSYNNSEALFKIGPRDISLEVIRGVEKNINLTVENLGSTAIDKITISYSSDLSDVLRFNTLVIENLSGFAVRNVPVKIVTPSRVDSFEGQVTFFTENFSDSSKVFISVVNKLNSSITSDNLTTGSLSSCVSVGGVLCFSDELCSGNYTNSVEGLCCLSQCIPRSKSGSGGSASTLLIIIGVLVLIVVGYMFYKKYKASKASPDNKINDLTKKFDNQFKEQTKK
ncbi:MAG: hypothetical protein AABW73_02875 [Nanoarchaeota archaeon]